jgi:hypothetical protein
MRLEKERAFFYDIEREKRIRNEIPKKLKILQIVQNKLEEIAKSNPKLKNGEKGKNIPTSTFFTISSN